MSSSVLLDITYSEAITSCETIFACYPMGNKIRAPLSVSNIINNSLQEISITVNGNPFQFPLNKYVLKRVAKTNDSFSYITILTEYNSEVYFKGITSNNLSKLFKINSQGLVTQISNINPNQNDDPSSAIVFNNELYFIARDGSNNGGDLSFFKVNSSGMITKILSKIVSNLIVYDNHLYFTYQPTVNFGPLLHKLSTSNELKKVVQINLEQGSQDNIGYLTIYNNELFFSARIGYNSKLFKIKEEDDIRQVSDLSPGSYDEPSNLMVFNNELYFMAAQNDLTKLFKLNGAGIISQVTNTNPGEQDLANPQIVFNNELYFVSYDSNYIDRLYKINAQGNITQVAVINEEFGDSPGSFIQFQNELYFKASIGDDNYRLYKMDANGNIVQFDDKESISTSFIVAHGGLYLTSNLDGTLELYKLTK